MNVDARSRDPKGVTTGGRFATETLTEATGTVLTAERPETVFTKRYETLDEKVEAFHAELEDQVAALADDANWNAYLNTMSKFHRYSGGGGRIIELRECRRAPAVSQRLKLLWRHRQVE